MSRYMFGAPVAFVVVLVAAGALLNHSDSRAALDRRSISYCRGGQPSESAGPAQGVAVARALEQMPLSFVENRGQLDSRGV